MHHARIIYTSNVQLNANQPVGNYWIRAAAPGQPKLVGFGGGINSAILRYVGAPNEEPTTNETESVNPLNEVNLHPLDDPFAVSTIGSCGSRVTDTIFTARKTLGWWRRQSHTSRTHICTF